MTTKERLIQLGMKENEIDSHCSDLYVKVNSISKKFVESEYQFPKNVTTFIDNIDHVRWYDIPFAYEEYYTK